MQHGLEVIEVDQTPEFPVFPTLNGIKLAENYGPGELRVRVVESMARRDGKPVMVEETLWLPEQAGRGVIPIRSQPLN